MRVVVTGARGFIGRNLLVHLQRRQDVEVIPYDLGADQEVLERALCEADVVFHLAGVNRPEREEDFFKGNVDFAAYLCERLEQSGRRVPLIFSSSIQAERDNPYGRSKLLAEQVIQQYALRSQATGVIYRLKNVFGKWCRPNYNSVVATFCHHIARDLPITISNPANALELVHVDDVVAHFMRELEIPHQPGVVYREVEPVFHVTLGELAELIYAFRAMRRTLTLPDFSDPFIRKLYGTYLSYLEPDDFAYDLLQRCDERGCLAEVLKSPTAGQIFVSATRPGVTRGNHYHHTKVEKFLVLHGKAAIRFRHIERDEVLEYVVEGRDFRVVDIPPGYTHSITNIGDEDLITLFWAGELFDPQNADTWAEPVQTSPEGHGGGKA